VVPPVFPEINRSAPLRPEPYAKRIDKVMPSAGVLAYALAFIAVMLAIETFLVQPLERHVARWRPKPA
jgi:hypothetical protein